MLDSDQLVDLAVKLSVLTEKDLSDASPLAITDELVVDLLMDSLIPRTRQIDELNMIPLYLSVQRYTCLERNGRSVKDRVS